MTGKNESNKVELFLLCFFIIIILPLLYLRRTIDPVMTIRMFFLTFVLFFINLVILFRFKIYKASFPVFRQLIYLAFWGYLLFSGLSLLKATNLPEALFDLSKVVLFFILLIFATLIIDLNKNNIPIVCKAISISAIIIASVGLIQYFFNGLYFIPGANVVYSTFTNRNLFASILFLSLPFSLWCFYVLPKRWSILSLISICFSFFIFTVVKTRSVWMANFFSFLVILLLIFFSKRSELLKKFIFHRKTFLLILLVVTIIGIAILLPPPSEIRQSQIGRKSMSSTSSLDVRLKAWKKTIPMIREHPWLGVGIGNWKIMLPKYGVAGMRSEQGKYQYLRPHNDFLWVWAELGIPGILFYVSIFAIFIIYVLRIIFRSTDKNDILLALFLLFGICGYLIISSFSFPKERIFHSVVLMLMIAITSIIYNKLHPVRARRTFLPGIPTMIVNLLLLFILLIYCYFRLKSEIHLYFSMQARRVMNHRVQLTALSEIDPRLYNMSPTGIPIHWFRGIAFYEINQIDLAYQDFRKAYQNHPHHIYIINNLASCYEIMDDHEKAIEFYNRVLSISPNFEESLINLSAVYYNMQNYEKAYETIQRCSAETEDDRYKFYKEQIERKIKSEN
ncbi:MAG: O-antigen ligase family protein [Candidatus Cloacimonetes bacterium]|nr:O-antigen ligase family protein [Candidatus Cloacimonadota bacterium]MCF7814438.1 O-antigen ligase family protein [Candidatus Cloacimonadota bacterium]MCF7868788.1 O-antigen ligase family protein [Candidatus Cloacimonadota bacterium]